MNLNCETIFDLYTLKNRIVLCQIKVSPKSLKLKNTCRCLSQEQWLAFDEELERLLAAKDNWNDEKSVKFDIKPNFQVKIQKSKLSPKHFYKCLDIIGDYNRGDIEEANLVLECVIDFQLEVPVILSVGSQEYEPEIKTSPDGKLCSQLPYEPYTPSKKTWETDIVNVIKNPEYTEDTYSPKPIFETGEIETLAAKAIPKYTPAPINAKRSLKEMKKLYHLDPLRECIIKMNGEITSVDKKKSLRTKLNKKSKRMRCEYIPKCEEVTKVEVPIYIPTPIEKTNKDFSPDNIRQNKKRSNTIDIFPEYLEENTKEKQISEKEQLNKNELKERSMTIDKIPAEIADVPEFFSTPIEQQTLQNVLKPCNHRINKERSNTIDVFPELLNENIKEEHISNIDEMGSKEVYGHSKRKKLRKRSNSTDEILAVPAESKEKVKSHKSIEKTNHLNDRYDETTRKKPEKELKTSPSIKTGCTVAFVKNPKNLSKTQTMVNKFEKGNRDHSTITDTTPEKCIQRDRKMETNKSLRRSERSPSKPKRFVEEERKLSHQNNCKKLKTSPKNKELFGTDDDDDDDCF